MKALVKYARGMGNMEIRDVPEPTPGVGEVKIKVKATGICGSDLHIYHDSIQKRLSLPVVVGHEFCGEIASVGSEVTEYKPGDRVVSETTFETCGTCFQCRTGNYNLCEERHSLGSYVDGAFTNYCIAKASMIHRIPINVDWQAAALTEPLACCVNAVDFQTGITAGDVVAVIGPGPMGLLCLQLAKANGAITFMIGLQQDKRRMELAESLGADELLWVEREDVVEKVNRLTGKRKIDIVFECSGSAKAIALGIKIVRRNGKYTQIGLSGGEVALPFDQIAYKQISVRGVYAHNWTAWEKALQYLETAQVDTKCLVSHIFPITGWKKAYEMIERKEGIKILLEPIT
jgi:L-iditol 2-dehydrogenase